MTPRERQRAMGAEAEAEIEDAKRRSQSEGWTQELRHQYLDAYRRLELSRDRSYWAELERDEPIYPYH